eukprot:5014455-Amphidinium_carterae.1
MASAMTSPARNYGTVCALRSGLCMEYGTNVLKRNNHITDLVGLVSAYKRTRSVACSEASLLACGRAYNLECNGWQESKIRRAQKTFWT